MAVSDNMTEGFITSGINFTELGQVGAILSPEDVAWADSCLTRDAEVLDSGWNSMKDALLENLSARCETSPHEKDKFSEGSEMEISHSVETGGMYNEVKSNIITAVSSNGAVLSSGNKLTHPRTDGFWPKYNIEDVSVPSYSTGLTDLGISNLETGLVVQSLQLDQSTEDIFRIWDLGIPLEDDDFIKQLNMALAETSLEPMPLASDHSVAWRCLNDESLSDLISGIADLSLSPNTG